MEENKTETVESIAVTLFGADESKMKSFAMHLLGGLSSLDNFARNGKNASSADLVRVVKKAKEHANL